MLDTQAMRFVGLLLSADIWRLFEAQHPFGAHFAGYIDILPETYDRQTVARPSPPCRPS